MAVVGPGLDGIILPMVESREQIVAFDWLVGSLERERGMPPGGIDIIPIIETGKGIANARTIAAAGTRVKRMAFGAGDYTLDMNMEWTLAESELEHARAEMAVASRAAGLEAPIDTVWVHINDLEGLASSAKRARQLGFQGKMCIYPPQVELVNRAFTPTETEIAFARRVVAAFEKAEREGSSSIQLDGFFIDYPIVYKAQRTLDAVRATEEVNVRFSPALDPVRCGVMFSHSINNSKAILRPITCTACAVTVDAVSPALSSGKPKRALSAATTRSQPKARLHPAPRA